MVDHDHDYVDHDVFDYCRDCIRENVFCQTLSITLSAVSPVSLSTAVYSETLPVVRKTVRGVSIISPKVPPYSLQIVITNLPNIPELKGPQYCNIAMYLFLAAQAAPYIYVWVNGSYLRNLNQGGYNYILAA